MTWRLPAQANVIAAAGHVSRPAKFVTVPALVLSLFRKSTQPGALLGIVGRVAFALMWAQLLKEPWH